MTVASGGGGAKVSSDGASSIRVISVRPNVVRRYIKMFGDYPLSRGGASVNDRHTAEAFGKAVLKGEVFEGDPSLLDCSLDICRMPTFFRSRHLGSLSNRLQPVF